jgi:hypothetical protein
MAESSEDRFWEEITGFATEFDVDKRWILRAEDDTRADGSLRIVSHPNCKYGHLKAFMSMVTKRIPKTEEEIENAIEDYQMDVNQLEVYSLTEHLETWDKEYEAPVRELEEIFGVKIF